MKDGLQIGTTAELSERVTPDVAITLGDTGSVSVYSTPSMINLMEHAARKVLEPFLEDGEESVGADVNVRHLAPTGSGQTVRAVARVTGIEGRRISFSLEAYDETQQIGEGTHTRFVIQLDRFVKNVQKGDLPNPQPKPELGPKRYETISFRSENGLGYLTLNRPKARNAISLRMVEELEDLLARLKQDHTTRVVIVTGAGDGFCSGDDIKELATLNEHEAEHLSLRQARMFQQFHTIPQVVIAAVNGPAMGGGMVFAMFADIRVASTAATFAMPEIWLGFTPGYGNSQLISLVGIGNALELTLAGLPIDARKAEQIGLVEHTAPHMMLMKTAEDLAEKFLAVPPIALRETKRALHRDMTLNPRDSYVNDTAAYMRGFNTEDTREGIAAFIEKRPPRWKGR